VPMRGGGGSGGGLPTTYLGNVSICSHPLGEARHEHPRGQEHGPREEVEGSVGEVGAWPGSGANGSRPKVHGDNLRMQGVGAGQQWVSGGAQGSPAVRKDGAHPSRKCPEVAPHTVECSLPPSSEGAKRQNAACNGPTRMPYPHHTPNCPLSMRQTSMRTR
jgi:hypothetical protein